MSGATKGGNCIVQGTMTDGETWSRKLYTGTSTPEQRLAELEGKLEAVKALLSRRVPIYAACPSTPPPVDEIPSLSTKAHEVAQDELGTAEVVAMWQRLKERHEAALGLLRRLRVEEASYDGGGPFEEHCCRCRRTREEGHRSDCLTGALEEFLQPPRSPDLAHRHVFDSDLCRKHAAECRVRRLRCACGAVRLMDAFAGPELRAGLEVRLTAQGRRIIEQAGSDLGTDWRPAVEAGDEGVIECERAEGIWECRFAKCGILVTKEMVR